ncbi:hypothetical protein H0G86_011716 [Trichoderma simmonsii]|uniref:Uncharacterized protein n=1 Tax=Trichoderma simmonsii TaxID=1491479 RepID=A0A8G0LM27_9HYPO|nr:hypothetical protein H0G86_011716 [Trichoderma simmonsii]
MTTPAYEETPTTNGNGHIDADGDITMDTGEEAATNANTNMEIDAHVPTQSTIRESFHHRYPKLIAEIWKRVCTAYSCVPGVHIFSLEEPQRRVENAFNPRWMPLGPPRLGPRDGGYGWYFRNANAATPSFDAHNPSTYLIDSGLWTACQQSRKIMRDAYGFDSWNRIIASHPDLLYYEPKRQNHEANSSQFIVKYIAELAAQTSTNTTLWFVDERFKRKTIAPTQEQIVRELRRRVFHGSDRQYVEVMGNKFPLDHDQWELLPQKMLPMTDPPICDPFGPGGHLWTWKEDLLDPWGDGLHWSGEWFIHTLQYYIIQARVKAQREMDRREAEAKALTDRFNGKPENGGSNDRSPTDSHSNKRSSTSGDSNEESSSSGDSNNRNPTNSYSKDESPAYSHSNSGSPPINYSNSGSPTNNYSDNGSPKDGNHSENGNSNGEHRDDQNGDRASDDSRNTFSSDMLFDGTEVRRFGLLAVEFF